MTPRAQRRVLACGVIAVALWPLVHAVGVARLGANPWEFFGWAMYALPAPRLQVRVEVEREGRLERAVLAPAEREALRAYTRRRNALGRAEPPASFARTLLARDATRDAIVITERRIVLDRASARLRADDTTHRIAR